VIIIVGRAHSGTSMLVHLLQHNGVFMGDPVNDTGDWLGKDGRQGRHLEEFWRACRMFGKLVTYDPSLNTWDIPRKPEVPEKVVEWVRDYVQPVTMRTDSTASWSHCGFKMPQSMLMLPWLVQMFSQSHYIYITRNMIDTTARASQLDNLHTWNVPGPSRNQAQASWLYHHVMATVTPKPERWLHVDYDDMIDDQACQLNRIERFLGMPIKVGGEFKIERRVPAP